MPVTRLLAIASVERTGSTLLCSILRATKVAGHPLEYLNVQTDNFDRLRRRLGAPRIRPHRWPVALVRSATGRYPWRDISSFTPASVREYLLAVAEANATTNGVFGVKMHWNQYRRHMLDLGLDVGLWGAPVSWVRITRRDEVRQAISFVRAAQTESWNSNMAATSTPVYDADAIAAALRRIDDENESWDRHLARLGVEPLRVTYEALVADPDSVVRRILDSVGASVDTVPPAGTRPQSDETNREWARRFLAERPEYVPRASTPTP